MVSMRGLFTTCWLLTGLLLGEAVTASPTDIAGTWLSGDGDGKWSGGFIYDPNSGKTYRGKLRLVDTNTLEVRGFIGISLIGRTETWTRQLDQGTKASASISTSMSG